MQKTTRVQHHLDLLSAEIFASTREKLRPDPAHDVVQAVFWCLQTEDSLVPRNSSQGDYRIGVIALKTFDISKIGVTDLDIQYKSSEKDLLLAVIDKVRLFDPDILVGYELHNASWGYLIERGLTYGIVLTDELARVHCDTQAILHDRWGYRKASVFRVIGRHMLNVWRLMRSEFDLTSYRFENIAFHLLHQRMPHYSFQTLTKWYEDGPSLLRHRLFRYYLDRVQMNLDILDVSEVVSQTAQSSRVFGIDFYSALTRGSQFKVESVMLRIAKPENFIVISPSRKQVGEQRAIECLPLILEPMSQFYNSPLLVLDFQSLYPSIMIAYNYCYSTCLGRIQPPGQDDNKFGVTHLELPKGLLGKLEDHLNVSPNGVAYVKPYIRKSLLARMLTEILETRVMIKNAMKDYKNDVGLIRLLNARQLTLKYIANVTYGYTAAAFSGRMPNVEISDSIVQSGREILQRTIQTINDNQQWGGKVVYGDTDSVFVYLHGRTREQAFDIGQDIADTITGMNPAPIKLKFEKVYHPCVLITKKRYVGFKFERVDDKEPEFDAKGIETVRRDGTPATQKIMESCIKIFFRTQDLSEVKKYLYDQWAKILSNRMSPQDFIIAKEVRLGSYRSLPHGAQVAHTDMSTDPRAEPQYGERVPYVVVYRGPNARLKDRVMKPEALLQNPSLRLDGEYYIRKQIIPPLERVFQLVGADIRSWYEEMPRSQKAMALSIAQTTNIQEGAVNRIDRYYASSYCLVCRKLAGQYRLTKLLKLCEHCSSLNVIDVAPCETSTSCQGWVDLPCDSLDCPVYYERRKVFQDILGAAVYEALVEDLEAHQQEINQS
ncbi:DNA/RNA polymerase [Hesseltinella vesiculosa]|uniref:DNA polymerase n=1 Tax=Hesseltinella vesiculosa TaxID=101127 RepID=A0A1X2G8F4_9FUNG|nr:DNA/RNA polymerase [Hesseltinella vesiculosa]